MRRVLSTSEVVEILSTPSGAVEVLATGEAGYNEDKAQMEIRLDSQFRPVDAKSEGHPLPTVRLPPHDTVQIGMDWAEALPAARDIFHNWVKRVHQSVNDSKNLN